MFSVRIFTFLFLLSSNPGIILESEAFDPFTWTGVAVSSYFAGQYFKTCHVPESRYNKLNVPDDFISDFNGLSGDFLNILHGQRIVSDLVLRSLKNHLHTESPKKALVMSFHGPPGTGKTFVSSLIAKRLFRNGMSSNCVTLWIGKLDFPHSNLEKHYYEKIQRTIENKVIKCPRAVFIIDEMDNMANGVIDALKPYIDYHEQVDGVDYRKVVFIFMSNTGAGKITKVSFEKLNNGGIREDIKLKDFEGLIESDAFNEKGGLHKSSVVGNRLIDLYVPFLPLEKAQVKECIHDILFEKRCLGVTDREVENLVNLVLYNLGGYTIFSKDGCKNLDTKIAVSLDQPCSQNKN